MTFVRGFLCRICDRIGWLSELVGCNDRYQLTISLLITLDHPNADEKDRHVEYQADDH